MSDEVIKKLKLSGIVNDAWDKLDSDTQAQHILSNSNLYQQMQLIKETQREFKRLLDSENDTTS